MALMLLRRRHIPADLRLVLVRPTLLKSADTPAGTHWITVHPDGNKDEPGRPVLVRESTTHPGTYHVIGGAGGKLNHMTLTHVDPSKWKQRAKDNAKAKRDKKKALKERGLGDAADKGEQEISDASRKAKRDFVDTVADKLGWDKNWYRDNKDFENEGMDPTAAKLAANAHLRTWVGRAKAEHKNLVETIRRDHEARVSAGLGNLSLDANPYKATTEELDPEAMKTKIEDHAALAEDARREADTKRASIAGAYGDLAQIIEGLDPNDSKQAELVLAAKRDDNPAIVAAIEALQDGKMDQSAAAEQIRQVAQSIGSGKTALPEDDKAFAHQQVARLYQEAIETAAADPEAAARVVENAKKLAGDRGVTALDIIGESAKEGRGYKAPTKKRAVSDVVASGDVEPETLARKVVEVATAIQHVAEEGAQNPDGMPVGVIHALGQQKLALERAQEAMAKGDARTAAKFFLQSERYALSAEKHSQRESAAQAAIVDSVKRMKAAHQAVAEQRAEGNIGPQGDLDPATKVMAAARDIIAAAEKLRERERDLKDARKLLLNDPKEARQITADAKRADFAELDPARVDAAVRKTMQDALASGEYASHKALLDRLEDYDYFSSYGGGKQIAEGTIAKYTAQGRDAALSLLGQVVGGAPMLDRSTLDLLGPKAAARLVADHLANEFDGRPEQLKAVRDGLAAYHVARGREVAEGAMRACDTAMEQARQFENIGVSSSYDLSEMERYNRLRLEAVNQAMSAIGVAWGELNMTAELNWALADAKPNGGVLTIKPENRADENLIALSRALGLRDGEYRITPHMVSKDGDVKQDGGLTVYGTGSAKVIRRADPAIVARSRMMNNIRAGGPGVDEDGWLPQGFAKRTVDTWGMHSENRPDRYNFGEDDLHHALMNAGTDAASMRQAFRDYAGSKYHEGVPAHMIASRFGDAIQRHENDNLTRYDPRNPPIGTTKEAGAAQAAASDVLSHIYDNNAADSTQAEYNLKMMATAGGDAFRTGEGQSVLPTQAVTDDGITVEAAHRALAANPYGSLAFQPIGNLSRSDRKHLQEYYLKHMTGDAPPDDGEGGAEDEPEYDANGDLLNESVSTKQSPKDTRWDDYVSGMKRPENAYEMIQGHLRDQAVRSFVQHHNGLRPDAKLALGEERHGLAAAHYYASAPPEARAEMDKLLKMPSGPNAATRLRHHYAEGGYPGAQDPSRPFATVGSRAMQQLAPIWNKTAENFTPGKAVKMMPNLSMSGKYVNQQRMIKAIRKVKRLGVFAGVGSGKTAISLGGFTDARADGEARAALFAVPQNMQGQFGAEAATYIDPNSGIKIHAKPGTEKEERGRVLAGHAHHIAVTTHQSLRDDTVRAIAEHRFNGDEEAAKTAMREEPRATRAQMVKEAFAHKGWSHRLDYFAVDEGHEAVNRQGKENSVLANVIDAISDNAKHYVALTGTPVKNDPSEAYDWLSKIDPQRHPEEGREDFMIRHGGIGEQVARIREHRRGKKGRGDQKDWSHMAIAESVQRELSPYFYSTRVPLDTHLGERNLKVPLTEEHQARYNRVTELYSRAASARQRGAVDTDAVRELSPNSFAGIPPEQHEEHAKGLLPALGMLRESAYNRVLHTGAGNSKNEAHAQLVKHYSTMPSQRKNPDGSPITGRPTITFTTGIEAAKQLHARLLADGHRVGLITGQMSGREKERVKLGFQPPDFKQNGNKNAIYDHLICTNAVSAGADMPRAEAIIHHDVPMTAKSHEQRTARAHRLSNDVNVEMTNLVSDTPHELTNLMRLERKYALADVFQNPAENLDESGLQRHIAMHRVAEAAGAAARRVARTQGSAATRKEG